MKPLFTFGASIAALFVASAALCDESGDSTERRGPARDHGVSIEVGARSMIVHSDGFSPYSESSFFPGVAVTFEKTIVRVGAISIDGLGEYDFGVSSDEARGQQTELHTHRFALGVSPRWHVTPRFALFTKLAPSAVLLRGDIQSMNAPLEAESWTWNLDVTGGAGVRMTSPSAPVGFWFFAEAGYSFAGDAPMTYEASLDANDPRRFGVTELPGLRLQGPVTRLAFAFTF